MITLLNPGFDIMIQNSLTTIKDLRLNDVFQRPGYAQKWKVVFKGDIRQRRNVYGISARCINGNGEKIFLNSLEVIYLYHSINNEENA